MFPRFLVPPGAQYSSGTPQEKSGAEKSGEHVGQLTEAQREKKTPLETVLQPSQVIAECFVCESLVHLLETIVG